MYGGILKMAKFVADTAHSELEFTVKHMMVTKVRGTFGDRKSTRLNSSHGSISYAVFCLKKKGQQSDEQSRVPRMRIAHRPNILCKYVTEAVALILMTRMCGTATVERLAHHDTITADVI